MLITGPEAVYIYQLQAHDLVNSHPSTNDLPFPHKTTGVLDLLYM